MTHIIPEGTSEPQDFALRDAGVAIDGSQLTVALEIEQWVAGVNVSLGSPAPTVSWLEAAAGTVRVVGTGPLEVGTYLVRFRLTDTSNLVGFVPNQGKPDTWRVVPVP